MKKIILFLIFCLINVAVASNNTLFKDTTGNSIKISNSTGKWIILNYWASWCPSCIQEIPELNRFYKNNSNKNIVLLGVNYDNPSLDELKLALKKSKMKFPNLTSDPQQEWKLGQIEAIPTTFIINPQGKLVKKIVGPTSEKTLMKIMQEFRV